MDPKVVFGIYGSALIGPICLFAAYCCWQYKKDKKNPPPSSVKKEDNTNGEKTIDPKFIKVVCKGLRKE